MGVCVHVCVCAHECECVCVCVCTCKCEYRHLCACTHTCVYYMYIYTFAKSECSFVYNPQVHLLDFPNILIKGSELQLPFQACLKVSLHVHCLM